MPRRNDDRTPVTRVDSSGVPYAVVGFECQPNFLGNLNGPYVTKEEKPNDIDYPPIVPGPRTDKAPNHDPAIAFRTSGPAEGNPNYDYPGEYTKLGIKYQDKVISVPNNISNIPSELKHGSKYYVGLSFSKPSNATKVSVVSDLAQYPRPIDLTRDGPSVHQGQFIEYFSISSGDSSRVMSFDWIDKDGKVINETRDVVIKVTHVESGPEMKSKAAPTATTESPKSTKSTKSNSDVTQESDSSDDKK